LINLKIVSATFGIGVWEIALPPGYAPGTAETSVPNRSALVTCTIAVVTACEHVMLLVQNVFVCVIVCTNKRIPSLAKFGEIN